MAEAEAAAPGAGRTAPAAWRRPAQLPRGRTAWTSLYPDSEQLAFRSRRGAGGELEHVVAAAQPRQRHFDYERLLLGVLGQRNLDRQRLAGSIEQSHFAAIERADHRPLGANPLIARE